MNQHILPYQQLNMIFSKIITNELNNKKFY